MLHFRITQNTRALFRFYITILVIVYSFDIISQTPKLKFEYLTPADGLSQATVSRMVEDRDGFMWFGTHYGLNRYDGYTFTKYFHDPTDSSSLSGDYIECIFVDKEQNLWIGTNNGYSQYDYQHDAFINYAYKKNFPKNLRGISFSCMVEDSEGIYWLGTFGGGLVKWDRKTDTYTQYFNDPQNNNSINSNSIHAIVEDNEKNLWIGAGRKGLDLLKPGSEKFIHFTNNPSDNNSISSDYVWALGKDKSGKIWVGTLGGGLNGINKSKDGNYSFTSFKPNTNDVRRLKILSMFIDDINGIWLGTENGGLDYFNILSKTFVNYAYTEKEVNCLNNSSVQSVYLDKVGNLWVGTYTGGVNVNKKFRKNIECYRKIIGNENSLSYNAVTCFNFDNKSKTLWIGTDGGGVNVIDSKTNTYQHYYQSNSGLLSDAVLSICKDSKNRMWVGGWECGVNLYDRAGKKIIHLDQQKCNFPNNNIFDMVAGENGIIWISFGRAGFASFDYDKKITRVFNTGNSKLPSDWVYDISTDLDGNILLGHAGGLSIFDPVKETFESYSHDDNDSSSLNYNQVNTILVTHDSTIWVGTSRGLNRFSKKEKRFIHCTKRNGLVNNNIQALIEDDKHNIWISTNDGISCFSPEWNTFKNYYISDGLQEKAFTRSSCYKSADGKIYFGGPNGYNVFNPDSLLDNTNEPNVVLTRFSIFNSLIKPGSKNSPLKKNINECDTLIVSYKQSVISFEFAALDYTSPEQNQYAYLLEGFDKYWNSIGSTHKATYTNLNPGTYTLKIKATNNDGKWSSHEKTLTLIVRPPFWKTWWFRMLLILVVIIAILLYIRIRTNILKAQNLILEKRVKERTSELEEANALLEEKQEEINSQTEQLIAKTESLENVNEILLEQNKKIDEQNKELDKHRNDLEMLVEQRTSELEKALYKSEESDRLKSSFLANMSHEIRTPMNAIIGFTGMLANDDVNPTQRKNFVDIISKSGENLLYIIDDILDLSKIQANQLTLQNSSFNLPDFLSDIENSFLLEAERKNIELRLTNKYLPESFIIEADKNRLRQVLNNLIGNSIKFTTNGYVEFGVDKIDEMLTFYVKDTGIGIPANTGNTIFDRFIKLEDNTNKLYSGTGLGLAISKSLVELWNGKIWYDSIENIQTTFYFTHPVTSNPASTTVILNKKDEKIEAPNLKGKTVLIAEDEEYNYQLLQTFLRKSNAKIVWAKNGQEVIDYVEKNTPDLILMDIKLPLVSGIEASIFVKNLKPEIPIIAQTAFAFDNDIKELKKAGINDYLVKPIRSVVFYEMLLKYFKA